MIGPLGVILIDKDEVLLHIYRISNSYKLDLLFSHTYPIEEDISITETIVHTLYKGTPYGVLEWKISTRNIAPAISYEIAKMTGLYVDQIFHVREQELLLKGMVLELL